MFEVSGKEISELNDDDLRSLVALLCEAELSSRQFSTSAVTWGGDQNSSDGGVDVHVALPPGSTIDGFIPRSTTVFQVKKPDMQRKKIISEMKPGNAVLPVIQDLANMGGAYVIVSSKACTAHTALAKRRNSMREALDEVTNAGLLHTDFYDQTRLATWVRTHPALITWVKARSGRALSGWQPYGPWSGNTKDAAGEFILDDKLRINFREHRDAPAQSIVEAIDEIRKQLSQPRSISRLIGLSGVGKTRLVQALFDDKVGIHPLPPTLAIYTNLSDDPNPQPVGLASDLIARCHRAILIIDNCPPDLHQRLQELCSRPKSNLSVLTVEYDVRGDEPEGTQVIALEAASQELIEELIQRRYPHLSQIDITKLASVSGGNARIAIALAETVQRTETVAELSNDQLFQRLFVQRHTPDKSLLQAAKVCSLVYSFDGETLEGDDTELSRLAILANQSTRDIYGHVSELYRRNLVQQRGVWRAVLPHAVANRLAGYALEDIPYELIEQELVQNSSQRLILSFSRRLSFLNSHKKAKTIADQWLTSEGLLGNAFKFSKTEVVIFENIASVSPEAALEVLERAEHENPRNAITVWQRHRHLLRSIAYDAALFERCIQPLANAAAHGSAGLKTRDTADIVFSLFWSRLSGTHASVEQRLRTIENLIESSNQKLQELGLLAIKAMLKTTGFTSRYNFEFGARSRNFGYEPKSDTEIAEWYGGTLAFIKRSAFLIHHCRNALRQIIASRFLALSKLPGVFIELEHVFTQLTGNDFWAEGWLACKEVIQSGHPELSSNTIERIHVLEAKLRPADTEQSLRAALQSHRGRGLDIFPTESPRTNKNESEQIGTYIEALSEEISKNKASLASTLSWLFIYDTSSDYREIYLGRGLANGASDLRSTWIEILQSFSRARAGRLHTGILHGFMAVAQTNNPEIADSILNSLLNGADTADLLPELQSNVKIDERGVSRLILASKAKNVSAEHFRCLAFSRAIQQIPSIHLKEIIINLSSKDEGYSVALDMVHRRLDHNAINNLPLDPSLMEAGRWVLQNFMFNGLLYQKDQQDYSLATLARACLVGHDARLHAAAAAHNLKEAVCNHLTDTYATNDYIAALLEVQPLTVLNTIFPSSQTEEAEGIALFDEPYQNHTIPTDALDQETLIKWCEQDREQRYTIAAMIITPHNYSNEGRSQQWPNQAAALLTNAPDPSRVLSTISERLRPVSWVGSLATLLETNSKWLAETESLVTPILAKELHKLKNELLHEAHLQRHEETAMSRKKDERFE